MRTSLRLGLVALIVVALGAVIVHTRPSPDVALPREVSVTEEAAAEPAPTTTSTTSTTVAPTTTEAPTTTVPALPPLAPTTTVYVPPPTTTTAAPEIYVEPYVVAGPDPEPMVEPEPAAAGLPSYLVCVRQRESGGNYQAVNPSSGAGGAFQFLPSTWQGAGFASKFGVSSAEFAAPWQQDQAAIELYAGGAGASHWAGPGC